MIYEMFSFYSLIIILLLLFVVELYIDNDGCNDSAGSVYNSEYNSFYFAKGIRWKKIDVKYLFLNFSFETF